jgi:maltose/moltooligosaccharide transporter
MSMLAMPYQLLVHLKQKRGVYMGIFNMFIVIPMIIQIITMQYFVLRLVWNDPINDCYWFVLYYGIYFHYH